MNSERRTFIKQITLFSILVGIEPTKVLSANDIKLSKSTLKLVSETRKDYEDGLIAISNIKTAYELDDATLIKQNRLAIKLAMLSIENPNVLRRGNHNSISDEGLLKRSYDAFIKSKFEYYKSTPGVVQDFAPTVIEPIQESPKVKEAFYAVSAGYYTLKSALRGATCAAGILSSVFILKQPKLAMKTFPTCLDFFVSSVKSVEQFKKLEGNRQRNKANLINSSQSAITDPLNKYLNTQSWTMPTTNFQFKFPKSNLNLQETFNESGNNNLTRLDSLINERLANGVEFPNNAEMQEFFSKFQDELGNLFKDSVQQSLELESQQNQNEDIKQQERNMLYASFAQLLGVIAPSFLGEKESNLFNALMPIGLQLASAAPLGAVGWTAVGISVASTLLASTQKNPNVVILKALAQIQKQLNIIIKGIEQIQKNQEKIIEGINFIITEIDRLREIQETMFVELKSDINSVHKRLDDTELAKFNNIYRERTNTLYMIIVRNETGFQQGTLFKTLDSLITEVVEELNDPVFTRFARRSFDVKEIKQGTYYQYDKKPLLISLYDSIGLISAHANYSPLINDSPSNNLPISHPKLFYKLAGEIVDWLVMSKGKIETNSKINLCDRLLTSALNSKQNINDCCRKPVIERKISDYSTTMEKVLIELRKLLDSQHNNEFGKKFEEEDNYRKYCQLNSVGKNFVNGDKTTFGFDNSVITRPNRKSGAFLYFFNESNRYDDPILNLLRDLGIVTKIKRESHRPKEKKFRERPFTKIQVSENSMQKGTTLGSKRNSILVQYPKAKNDKYPQLPAIELQYSMILLADRVEGTCQMVQPVNPLNSADVWGPPRNLCNYTAKTATVNNGFKDINWKPIVKQELEMVNISFETLFPNHASMSSNDFFNYLIDKWFIVKKIEFLEKGLTKLDNEKFYDKIDGCGISLMVLSKLNQVVTSDYLVPYDIDYSDEIFTQDDFKNALEYYSSQDFGTYSIYNEVTKERDKNLYQEILKEYELMQKNPPQDKQGKKESIFYLVAETETPLNPTLFIDLMCILMKRRVLKTVTSCKSKIRDIKENDCEPYLADTINMLRLFRDEYLNAPV